jgi:predicted transcriptional regulator
MKTRTEPRPTLDELTRPAGAPRDSALQAWHDAETRKAMAEADAGDFATADEVTATVRKFVRNA